MRLESAGPSHSVLDEVRAPSVLFDVWTCLVKFNEYSQTGRSWPERNEERRGAVATRDDRSGIERTVHTLLLRPTSILLAATNLLTHILLFCYTQVSRINLDHHDFATSGGDPGPVPGEALKSIRLPFKPAPSFESYSQPADRRRFSRTDCPTRTNAMDRGVPEKAERGTGCRRSRQRRASNT